jgi:uroporphyrinogen-III synthase
MEINLMPWPNQPGSTSSNGNEGNSMTGSGRIILTREVQQNKSWALQLRNQGHEVLELPMLQFEILPCDPQINTAGYQWILFTSIQGVRGFVKQNLDPGQAMVGALGKGTAQALAEYGMADTLNIQGKDGVAMAENFISRFTPPGAILLPGALDRIPGPVNMLLKAGFSVTELPLYQTLPTSCVSEGDFFTAEDVVFFCSPSAVIAFSNAFPMQVSCVAIGETTASACTSVGLQPVVSLSPTLKAMIQAAGLDSSNSPVQPEIES